MGKREMERALNRARKAAGGQSGLARELGMFRQGVQKWKICPPERVLAVEKASGISRHDLRPDLYPKE